MSDSNFSAIRARLKYPSIEAFKQGYGRYISAGGMFVPMSPQKLKPVGTTVRFQFLLADGTSALLGEGVVRQIRGVDGGGETGPVGMLVKFTKLSPESKSLVDEMVHAKSTESGARRAEASSGGNDDHTAEAEIPDELLGDEEDSEDVGSSGDEIFGGASEPAIPMHTGLDDPSEVVAAALAQGSEPYYEAPPAPPASEHQAFSASDASVDADDEDDSEDADALYDLDDLFGPPEDDAPEQASEPSDEATLTAEEEPAPPALPDDGALKRTEGGLKVMAFDGQDIGEEAAREFEMFAAGDDDDEIDEMFDNVFGGGGGDDFFGGGGAADDDGEDVFGGGFSEPALEPEPPAVPQPAASSTIDLGDEADLILEEEEPDPFGASGYAHSAADDSDSDSDSDSEELVLDAVSDSEEILLEEVSDSEEILLDEVSDSEEFELGDEPSDDGPNEEILSLLSMEEESEAENRLNSLSLGAGLAESSASSADDDEPDSFEALLASAKREIDSKKEPEDEKKGDILDDLLGDDDLPPVPGSSSTFAVPQPGDKKKKGGFMSKLFGKD